MHECLKELFKLLLLLYVDGCFICIEICVPLVCSAAEDGRQHLLGLELKSVASCHVGASNHTWILWKSS